MDKFTPMQPVQPVQSESLHGNDLFDNNMVRSAYEAMSPEQREKYKKMGEHMFNKIDFVDSQVINSMPVPMGDAAEYTMAGVKSGLHPSELDPNEKLILASTYGDNWYEDLGYEASDLDKVV